MTSIPPKNPQFNKTIESKKNNETTPSNASKDPLLNKDTKNIKFSGEKKESIATFFGNKSNFAIGGNESTNSSVESSKNWAFPSSKGDNFFKVGSNKDDLFNLNSESSGSFLGLNGNDVFDYGSSPGTKNTSIDGGLGRDTFAVSDLNVADALTALSAAGYKFQLDPNGGFSLITKDNQRIKVSNVENLQFKDLKLDLTKTEDLATLTDALKNADIEILDSRRGIGSNKADLFNLNSESSGFFLGLNEDDVFDYGSSPGTKNTSIDGGLGRDTFAVSDLNVADALTALSAAGYKFQLDPNGGFSLITKDNQRIKVSNVEDLQFKDLKLDLTKTEDLATLTDALRNADIEILDSRRGIGSNKADLFNLNSESSGFFLGLNEDDVFDYGSSPGTKNTSIDGGLGRDTFAVSDLNVADALTALSAAGYKFQLDPNGGFSLITKDNQRIKVSNVEDLQFKDLKLDLTKTEDLATLTDALRNADIEILDSRRGIGSNKADLFNLNSESSGIFLGLNEDDVFDYGSSPGTKNTSIDGGLGRDTFAVSDLNVADALTALSAAGYKFQLDPNGGFSLITKDNQRIKVSNVEDLQFKDLKLDLTKTEDLATLIDALKNADIEILD